MTEMTPAKATALRKPFPKESIGQLPKGGQMLDFVGHAAVTDRLLTVDPEWSWEFSELDPATGKPSLRHSLDPDGNLWIRLTICGVSRIGVGDGKNAKERIGDAIRNAAMRFGVALDLWAKENLVEFANAATTATRRAQEPPIAPPLDEPLPTEHDSGGHPIDVAAGPMKPKTRGRLFALFGELNIPEEEQLPGINSIIGASHTSRSQLTEGQARAVIKRLEEKRSATRQEQPA